MKMLGSFLILLCSMVSCTKTGCTNSDATNYKKRAQEDDGSCVYPEWRDDMVGQYAVKINEETFFGYNQGISSYLDTLIIKKGYYYNGLVIDNDYYVINFQNGRLKFCSNITKSPPTGSGYLINGNLNLNKTIYTLSGSRIIETYTLGKKIN